MKRTLALALMLSFAFAQFPFEVYENAFTDENAIADWLAFGNVTLAKVTPDEKLDMSNTDNPNGDFTALSFPFGGVNANNFYITTNVTIGAGTDYRSTGTIFANTEGDYLRVGYFYDDNNNDHLFAVVAGNFHVNDGAPHYVGTRQIPDPYGKDPGSEMNSGFQHLLHIDVVQNGGFEAVWGDNYDLYEIFHDWPSSTQYGWYSLYAEGESLFSNKFDNVEAFYFPAVEFETEYSVVNFTQEDLTGYFQIGDWDIQPEVVNGDVYFTSEYDEAAGLLSPLGAMTGEFEVQASGALYDGEFAGLILTSYGYSTLLFTIGDNEQTRQPVYMFMRLNEFGPEAEPEILWSGEVEEMYETVELKLSVISEGDNGSTFELYHDGNFLTELLVSDIVDPSYHAGVIAVGNEENGLDFLLHTFSITQTGESVSVDDTFVNVHFGYNLKQNYPNPFNPTTTINYSIPVNGTVKLSVYSITGQLIDTIVNEYKLMGNYSINFDGSNLASGTYIYRIEVNGYTATRAFTLIK